MGFFHVLRRCSSFPQKQAFTGVMRLAAQIPFLFLLFRKRSRQVARLVCKRTRCRFVAYHPFTMLRLAALFFAQASFSCSFPHLHAFGESFGLSHTNHTFRVRAYFPRFKILPCIIRAVRSSFCSARPFQEPQNHTERTEFWASVGFCSCPVLSPART